jgi:Zn-finger nucleic acid-binding protein
MTCPSCGAAMHLKPGANSFVCEYCRSAYFPEKDDDGVRVLDEPTGEICPGCSVALMPAAIAKVRIEYCTRCHGMLIPMGALEGLVEELRGAGRNPVEQPAADTGDLRRRLDCPHCRRRMDVHFYSGPGNVILGSCENCALNWLDRGALARIIQAPDEQKPESVFETALGDDDTTGSARW